MKKADLIKVAEEFNILMDFDGDEAIDTGLNVADLKQEVKKAALWLYATDEISEETVSTLKQLEWSDEDFKTLKDDQDPLPAFYRHEILFEKKEKEKPKTQKKKEEPAPEPEPEEEPQEYTEAPPPKKEKPKGPSAYATAHAIMGENPKMSYPDLMDRMKAEGFDIQTAAGTIKTARAMSRKSWNYFVHHGFIKDEYI